MKLHKSKESNGVRYWLKTDEKYEDIFHWEFYPGGQEFGCYLTLEADFESTVCFTLKLPYLFRFYFVMDRKWGYSDKFKKFLRLNKDHQYDGRKFGIDWYKSDSPELRSGELNLYFGDYINGWSSRDPIRRLSFSFSEWLYGDVKYSTNALSTVDVPVTIKGSGGYADKDYVLTVELFESVWSFERFKPPYKMVRSEVTSNEPIPHPGKGTCSYNCDEGALHSQTGPYDTVEVAVEKFLESVDWYRKNYPL